jgi:hypothetical protein
VRGVDWLILLIGESACALSQGLLAAVLLVVFLRRWYHMPVAKKPHQALKPLQRVKVAMTVAPDEQGRWPL